MKKVPLLVLSILLLIGCKDSEKNHNETSINFYDKKLIKSYQDQYGTIRGILINLLYKFEPNKNAKGTVNKYNTKKGGTNCLMVVIPPCFLFT